MTSRYRGTGRWRAIGLAVAVATLSLTSRKVQAQAGAARSQADDPLDSFLRDQVRRRQLAGLAVAIIRDARILKTAGYGMANVELAVPATRSTAFQIASLTKLFTATAVMQLVEDGKLSLDDSVSRHVSGLPPAWAGITVRQLLAHSSGIPNFTETEAYAREGPRDRSPRETIALVSSLPLQFPPGTRVAYSNTGYILLGLLIERVSGQSYGAFLATRQLAPSGMRHTEMNDPRSIVPNRAQSYEWKGRELRNALSLLPNAAYSAGAMISTANDLALWDVAITQHRLLRETTQEQMWSAIQPLGWSVGRRNGHRTIGHAGDIAGFTAQYTRFEDDGLTVIVLLNGRGVLANAQRIAGRIADRVMPALAAPVERIVADPDPARTTRYARLVQNTFIDGKADLELLNETMRTRTSPERLATSHEQLAIFGTLHRLELLERRTDSTGVHLRYRAVFEGDQPTVFVDVAPGGKISGLGIRSPSD